MSNIRTAMNRGAFDFVTKPIDFQDLQKSKIRMVECRTPPSLYCRHGKNVRRRDPQGGCVGHFL